MAAPCTQDMYLPCLQLPSILREGRSGLKWPIFKTAFNWNIQYMSANKVCVDMENKIKGTVSRDWDGLFVVWMERALFRDEPLIIFTPFIVSWFLTLNFTFFRGIAQRLPLCVQLRQPFCNVPKVVSNPLVNFLQGVRDYWQPSSKFVTGCQRLLATLWQILQRVLINFAKSTDLPEGCQHLLIVGQRVLITLQSNCQRVLDNLNRHLQQGCPINKERGNLFAIPLKKLKFKINIQEATDSFINFKRFIF